MNLYRALLRPLMFRLDPETAHEVAMTGLRLLSGLAAATGRQGRLERRPVEAFGLAFPNPVGLAAGFDKNALALCAWPHLGFGFVEIGTVTALPQPGNPRPRLFRVPAHGAIINRMGFNNDGAEAVARRLARARARGAWPRVPVGVNIGKSKVTPLESAAADYARSFRLLRPFGDYFVINVSSPNTPGLRRLQAAESLRDIVRAVAEENPVPRRPILVKVAPDLADDDIAAVAALADGERIDGFVATNTTLDHSALRGAGDVEGGLSGAPLRERSTAVIRLLADRTRLPVIGVGGIADAASARDKLDAGARLVQIYTGLVYEGPRLPARIVESL